MDDDIIKGNGECMTVALERNGDVEQGLNRTTYQQGAVMSSSFYLAAVAVRR